MADSASDLTLEVIRSLEGLESLREDWTRLFGDASDATPFQAWEWNRGLAEALGTELRLRVLVAREPSGRVVAIAPFHLRAIGVPGITALELLGGRISDYLDLLVDDRWREPFAERLSAWLEAGREWSLVHLRNLRAEALGLVRGSRVQVEPLDVCPYADLPESLEAYEKTLPGPLRKTVTRGPAVRLAREGRLAFTLAKTEEEVRRELPEFFALHQARQRANGERGRFFDPRWCRIFRSMSLGLFGGGVLRLAVLRIDGRPAAAAYNLRVRNREYFYSTGMEPALAEHRPGSLLQHWLIGEAIRDGVRRYDFGRGNEPYKRMWTNARCEIFDLRLARSPLAGLIERRGEQWRRRLTRSRTLKRIYRWTVGRRTMGRAAGADGA